MPSRIQRSRAKGWRMPEGAIYVGRPGPWGNPFVIGPGCTAARAVDLYRWLLSGYLVLSCGVPVSVQRVAVQYAKAHIEELRDKDLACWCPLDAPCHADVLIEAARRTPEQRAAAYAKFKKDSAEIHLRATRDG